MDELEQLHSLAYVPVMVVAVHDTVQGGHGRQDGVQAIGGDVLRQEVYTNINNITCRLVISIGKHMYL